MAAERSAVLLDWGGVMTGDLFGSFRAFCAAEGLDPDILANLFRHDRDARALLIDFECGRIEEADFEPRLSTALGLAWHEGLIDRLFAAATLDDAMVEGGRARTNAASHRLVSNSWGTRRYPRDAAGRALRRHRHLRRGGLPQARPAHVRARRAAHRRRAGRVRVRRRPGLQPRPRTRARDGRGPPHVGRDTLAELEGWWAKACPLNCAAQALSPRERSPPPRRPDRTALAAPDRAAPPGRRPAPPMRACARRPRRRCRAIGGPSRRPARRGSTPAGSGSAGGRASRPGPRSRSRRLGRSRRPRRPLRGVVVLEGRDGQRGAGRPPSAMTLVPASAATAERMVPTSTSTQVPAGASCSSPSTAKVARPSSTR